MMSLGGSEWKERESGLFSLDILGAVFLLVSLMAGMAYINGQLANLRGVEAAVTAESLAADQLDKLCIEKNAGDLGIQTLDANGCSFRMVSSKEATDKEDLDLCRVFVEWEGAKGMEQLVLERKISAWG